MKMAPSSWIVTQPQGRRHGHIAISLCTLLSLWMLLFFAAASFAQAQEPGIAPDAEQQVLRMLNRERESRGLRPLAPSDTLRQAARQHSQRMAASHRIGHQLAGEPDLGRRLAHQEQPFDSSGENVAVAPDAASAHDALMHSPGHRANILDRDFNAVGIGVVRAGGQVYVTQDFAQFLARSSVEQVEEQVAAHLSQGRRAAGELRRVEVPELRRRACEMAAHDRLNPRAGMLDGASGSVAFTALDLAQIPDSLRSLRSRPARAFSVGACYQSSASYEEPVYWVIVVTYL